jgi:hypothetical protein
MLILGLVLCCAMLGEGFEFDGALRELLCAPLQAPRP